MEGNGVRRSTVEVGRVKSSCNDKAGRNIKAN